MLNKIGTLISTVSGPTLASSILVLYGLALAMVVVTDRVIV
jgi:hypothetical protein